MTGSFEVAVFLDPANGLDGQFDVAMANGRIAAVEEQLDVDSASRVWDASGKLVTPGLVDLHTHTYDRVNAAWN